MNSKKGSLALALALACIPVAAFAEDNRQQNGWFVGLAYAHSSDTTIGANIKWSTDMTSLNAGYRWAVGSQSAIGVELGGGSSNNKFTLDSAGSVSVSVSVNGTQGFVGMNGRTNFGQSRAFGLYRLGAYSESVKLDGTTYTSNSAMYAGLGIGADLTPRFNIQASYLYLSGSGDDPNRNAIQIGLEYRF
jgi:hypothetical protein